MRILVVEDSPVIAAAMEEMLLALGHIPLGPVGNILAIILPITTLMQGILEDGQGVGITVLTWILNWAPFAVLARLGSGIPAWEVIGAGLLLAVFVAVELVLMGRLFRASLLAQGQKLSVAELFSRMNRQRT